MGRRRLLFSKVRVDYLDGSFSSFYISVEKSGIVNFSSRLWDALRRVGYGFNFHREYGVGERVFHVHGVSERVVKKWPIIRVERGVGWRRVLIESCVRFRLFDLRLRRYRGVGRVVKEYDLVDLFPDL